MPALIFSILNLPSASDADPKVVPSNVIFAKGKADLFDASKIWPSSLNVWANVICAAMKKVVKISFL